MSFANFVGLSMYILVAAFCGGALIYIVRDDADDDSSGAQVTAILLYALWVIMATILVAL